MKITYAEQRSNGGAFTFTTLAKGIVFATGASMRKGGAVYSSIAVNGHLCARDRGVEASIYASTNYHASASCTFPLEPGTHTVQITERVTASNVIVVEF